MRTTTRRTARRVQVDVLDRFGAARGASRDVHIWQLLVCAHHPESNARSHCVLSTPPNPILLLPGLHHLYK